MDVQFTPDTQAKLEKLARETGRPLEDLVEDIVVGYFDALVRLREEFHIRYDDVN